MNNLISQLSINNTVSIDLIKLNGAIETAREDFSKAKQSQNSEEINTTRRGLNFLIELKELCYRYKLNEVMTTESKPVVSAEYQTNDSQYNEN